MNRQLNAKLQARERRIENSFFRNKQGRIEYNEKCMKCKNTCKQSHKAKIYACKHYNEKPQKQQS